RSPGVNSRVNGAAQDGEGRDPERDEGSQPRHDENGRPPRSPLKRREPDDGEEQSDRAEKRAKLSEDEEGELVED
ncbi:cyclin pch1, partial [Fusarium napiforme]